MQKQKTLLELDYEISQGFELNYTDDFLTLTQDLLENFKSCNEKFFIYKNEIYMISDTTFPDINFLDLVFISVWNTNKNTLEFLYYSDIKNDFKFCEKPANVEIKYFENDYYYQIKEEKNVTNNT